MRAGAPRVTTLPVRTGPFNTHAAQSAAPPDNARGWEAVRADGDIQFTPLPDKSPPKPPEWLKKLQEWLADLFGPLGEWLGGSWHELRWVLLGIGAILLLWLIWRIFGPMIGWLSGKKQAEDTGEWSPDREQAMALLEDADALAAQGRYDEAAHLLLLRSVGQIRAVRPDWLDPSSTAREIAVLPALPEKARAAFAFIAQRVERSLFALRPLNKNDWHEARAAYADFALNNLAPAP